MEIVKIPLDDGSDYQIPDDLLEELDDVYFGVGAELRKMRLWCLVNPERRKTKKGIKRFIFNWIRRDCQIKPKVKNNFVREKDTPAEPLEVRKENLAKLKEALR